MEFDLAFGEEKIKKTNAPDFVFLRLLQKNT